MTKEKPIKVAIQGVAGCFHEMAAQSHFGTNIESVECLSFRKLCEVLEQGHADHAVMAIENTIAGSILQNYALLQEYHFHICGEVYMPIRMHLLALPGIKLNEIKYVESHHMAIKQCETFLNTLHNTKVVEIEDTALAAQKIRRNNLTDTAAIANELSAEIYQLEMLKKNIETNKANFTRFLVLNRTPVHKAENNKASICFRLNDKPGALADILMTFKCNNINLTKIQSLPIIGKPYEYSFHVDVEWNNRSDYEQAIAETGEHLSRLIILGEYIKGKW